MLPDSSLSEAPWQIGKGEGVVAWCFEGHLVVVEFDTGVLRLYNPTALAIWLLLGDQLSEEQLARELVVIFGATPMEVTSGLLSLLTEWQGYGWLTHQSNHYKLTYQVQAAVNPQEKTLGTAAQTSSASGPMKRAEYHIALAFPLAVHITAEEGVQPRQIFQRLCAIFAGFTQSASCDRSFSNTLTIDIHQETVSFASKHVSSQIEADATEIVSQTLLHLLKLGYPKNRLMATIHAAGLCGSNTKQGILIPGISGAGKSTLAVALADRGWHYLGDDIVGLSDEQTIMPLPTAASIKPNSWDVLPDHSESLNRLPVIVYSGKSAKYLPISNVPDPIGPVPLSRWVFPRFKPGASFCVSRMNPLEVLQGLIEAGMGLSDALTESDVARFLQMLHDTSAHQVIYSDIDEVAQWLSRA